jgi:iron complex transport system ATP-binding protein
MLELKNIGYTINKTTILEDISLSFKDHHFNVLLGPNGAGKSTLMKIATGVLPPSVGSVFLDDKDLSTYSTKTLALKRAVLSQHFDMTFPLSVKEVVMMGRYPHFDSTPSVSDRQIIESAIEKVSMTHKIHQNYMTLSGGEKQKVQMARVLAQIWHTPDDTEHKYLFLDEPTTSLDIHYQLQILDIAKGLLAHNTTVIAILHDLNLSFQYGNPFFFLERGKLVFQTPDKKAISEALVEQVYGVKARKWLDMEGEQDVWQFRL